VARQLEYAAQLTRSQAEPLTRAARSQLPAAEARDAVVQLQAAQQLELEEQRAVQQPAERQHAAERKVLLLAE
jgi:hypothetical protein